MELPPDWQWTDDSDMPSDAALDEQALREGHNRGRRSGDKPVDRAHPLPLSPLELQVLRLLAEGYDRDEIGKALYCNAHSAVRQVLRKTGARNAMHAVAIGIRTGLIS